MRVGFIGVDHTGYAVASRLLKAGHRLTVYDPLREMPGALTSAGAAVAGSIEEVCGSAEVVFTMLPDDATAEAVILSSSGVVTNLPPNTVHIGLSTISVECSDAIVEAHWNAAQQYVSAPLLVVPDLAAQEQVFVVAGGYEATIVQVERLLRSIGQLVRLAGWPSNANLIQLGAIAQTSSVSRFLAQYADRCAPQGPSWPPRRASRRSDSFDIATMGVLQ